jgi:2-C-methyl-D-erythritol 4-phosphate cytidylyltransferase
MPKALVRLRGRPMVAWCLSAMRDARAVERVVIAAPPGTRPRSRSAAREALGEMPVTSSTGGETRSESVANAIAAADEPTSSSCTTPHGRSRPRSSSTGAWSASLTGAATASSPPRAPSTRSRRPMPAAA